MTARLILVALCLITSTQVHAQLLQPRGGTLHEFMRPPVNIDPPIMTISPLSPLDDPILLNPVTVPSLNIPQSKTCVTPRSLCEIAKPTLHGTACFCGDTNGTVFGRIQ